MANAFPCDGLVMGGGKDGLPCPEGNLHHFLVMRGVIGGPLSPSVRGVLRGIGIGKGRRFLVVGGLMSLGRLFELREKVPEGCRGTQVSEGLEERGMLQRHLSAESSNECQYLDHVGLLEVGEGGQADEDGP